MFTTFHDDKPLEPLVTAKWENFNVKVNATIADILRWVSSLASHARVLCKQSLKEQLSTKLHQHMLAVAIPVKCRREV